MTPNQLAYRRFLSTLQWSMLRDACIQRDGHRCVRCRSAHILQAHHVTYPKEWTDTTLDHLQTLCRACHEREHGIKPVEKMWHKTSKGRKWLAKQAKLKLKENWKAQGRVW